MSVRCDKRQRANWLITAGYELSGAPAKRKELNIRSVLAGDVPEALQIPSGAVHGRETPPTSDSREEDVPDRQAATGAYRSPGGGFIVAETPAADFETGVCVHSTTWVDGDALLPIRGRVLTLLLTGSP